MATGYAKSTGKLGVCLATSGPGAIHLLNGLYDAKLDHAPGARHHRECRSRRCSGPATSKRSPWRSCTMDVAEYNEMIHVPASCRPWSTWPSATP